MALPLFGVHKVFVPVFYALDREKVAVWASFISIVFNICFCLATVPVFGFQALALGMGVSVLTSVVIQGEVLRRELGVTWGREWLCLGGVPVQMGKMVASALLCGGVMAGAVEFLGWFPQGLVGQVLALGFYALLGGVSYLLALALMGEFSTVQGLVKRVFSRK